MINKVRCDHCGKWQEYTELVMPNTIERYQDGKFSICIKCSNGRKEDQEFWTIWYIKKCEQYDINPDD